MRQHGETHRGFEHSAIRGGVCRRALVTADTERAAGGCSQRVNGNVRRVPGRRAPQVPGTSWMLIAPPSFQPSRRSQLPGCATANGSWSSGTIQL
jgi:hypothetical protein